MLLRLLRILFKTKPICVSCNKRTRKLERLSAKESPSVYQALEICKDCHSDPQKINQHNVSANLRSWGYKSADVDTAFALIRGFKEDSIRNPDPRFSRSQRAFHTAT